METDEAAWVAGILEGEACFDLNNGRPRVRVEMKDVDVIHRLHGLVGGRVTFPKKHNAKPTWSDTALLSVNKQAEVEPLLRTILPWMGERRFERIQTLLSVYR